MLYVEITNEKYKDYIYLDRIRPDKHDEVKMNTSKPLYV